MFDANAPVGTTFIFVRAADGTVFQLRRSERFWMTRRGNGRWANTLNAWAPAQVERYVQKYLAADGFSLAQ